MNHLRLLLCGLLLLAAPISAAAPAPRHESLEARFDRFLDWFPGRYDSALQTRIDVLERVPAAERNYRRHSIFRRVDLPAFGPVVFYAEQYRDGDPERVYRQRIYQLSIDPARDAIRLRVHVPDDVAALRGAYRDPSLLAELTPAATTVWEGCDLWWRWAGDQFRGTLDPGACRFQSDAFGQEIMLDETLLLGADEIRFADRGLALDGSYLFGMRGEVPNISRAIRPFLCDVLQDGNVTTHWTHDQGGRIGIPGAVLELQRWNVSGDLAHHGGRLHLALADAEPAGVDGQDGADGADGANGLDRVNGAERASATEAVDAERIGLVHDGVAIDCRYAPEALYDDGP